VLSRARRTAHVAGATALLGVLSCGSEPEAEFGFATGPSMLPGDDCLRCHSAGSAYPTAPHWSLAGTVFPTPDAAATAGVHGVEVVVATEAGAVLETLTTNAVGNFYSNTPLPEGFRVSLRYQGASIEMPCPPPAGNCGACHSLPPIGGPPGRISIPQGAPPTTGTFDCETWSRK
jgi:hypothetical protein